MIGRIPPHIFWPGLIISLLSLSFAFNIVLVVKATNEDRAQILPDYYERAVDWDAQQEQELAAQRLGLGVSLHLERLDDGRARVHYTVKHANSSPILELVPTLKVFDPTRLEAVEVTPLKWEREEYSAVVPMAAHRVWNLEVRFMFASQWVVTRHRIEVAP